MTGALASILLAGALALGWQSPALAHDKLVSSTPKDGAALNAAPGQIVLTYNEAVQSSFAEVAVTAPGGTNIAEGEPQVVDNKVTQAVRAEAPTGTYTVSWRVVSSDGHPIDGTFTYSIKLIAPTPTATQTTTPSPEATTTASSAEPSTPASTPAGTSSDEQAGGGSPWSWVVVGALALIVIVVGGAVLARRGRQRETGAGTRNAG